MSRHSYSLCALALGSSSSAFAQTSVATQDSSRMRPVEVVSQGVAPLGSASVGNCFKVSRLYERSDIYCTVAFRKGFSFDTMFLTLPTRDAQNNLTSLRDFVRVFPYGVDSVDPVWESEDAAHQSEARLLNWKSTNGQQVFRIRFGIRSDTTAALAVKLETGERSASSPVTVLAAPKGVLNFTLRFPGSTR